MKKHSLKFWLIFWAVAVFFLLGWLLFWQLKNRGLRSLETVAGFLPVGKEQRQEIKTVIYFVDYFLKQDGVERTFLVLLQNNMELRPGGGYLGSFAILKIKNGKITLLETHDLSNFDGRIPDGIEPPSQMKAPLNITSWKLRDSNWSPDFPTNARKAEEFYYLGKGEEKFDGVIAVNARVLSSMLKITGPVSLPGYPGKYESESAILTLEYQVEKGFDEQGIPRGERKSIMNALAKVIAEKLQQLDNGQKLELARLLADDLKKKDIQLYFKDPDLKKRSEEAGWSGKLDQDWSGDFLAVVDANLGAYKSDYYIKRTLDYSVDLTKEKPEARLKITYRHTAKQKDWMTKDYLTYVRVYVPEGSWLVSSYGAENPSYGNELGKKYFGFLVPVKMGEEKTIEIVYTLPEKFRGENYSLKIQKQSGTEAVPVLVKIKNNDGTFRDFSGTLEADWIVVN